MFPLCGVGNGCQHRLIDTFRLTPPSARMVMKLERWCVSVAVAIDIEARMPWRFIFFTTM